MENYSENTKEHSVKSVEIVIYKRFVPNVHKRSVTKFSRFHQPIRTHTLSFRNRSQGRIFKRKVENSKLSVLNYLWRYKNKEKGSWIK